MNTTNFSQAFKKYPTNSLFGTVQYYMWWFDLADRSY